jgi:hypothetical protein
MKNLLSVVALSSYAIGVAARAVGYEPQKWIMPYKREALQDIVSLVGNGWVGLEMGWDQG